MKINVSDIVLHSLYGVLIYRGGSHSTGFLFTSVLRSNTFTIDTLSDIQPIYSYEKQELIPYEKPLPPLLPPQLLPQLPSTIRATKRANDQSPINSKARYRVSLRSWLHLTQNQTIPDPLHE